MMRRGGRFVFMVVKSETLNVKRIARQAVIIAKQPPMIAGYIKNDQILGRWFWWWG